MTTSQAVASLCTLLGIFTAISLFFHNYGLAAYGAATWILGYYTYSIIYFYEQEEDEEQDKP